MAADLPTTLSCRFGIRTYQLSDQDLLHPGDLVDRVIKVKDVARAGAFVVSIHTVMFNAAALMFIPQVPFIIIRLLYSSRDG